MGRDIRKLHNTDETGDQFIGMLADHFDCSESAAIDQGLAMLRQMMIGDVDPAAVNENRVSEDDFASLLMGELDSEQLPEDVRLDESADVAPVTSDGGAVARNPSYQPTLTPVEWAQPGDTKSWSDIKEALGKYWSDEFEMHPSHVPDAPSQDQYASGLAESYVRPSHRLVPRLLVAMVRSESDSEIVPRAAIEELAESKLSHLSNRGVEKVVDLYVDGSHYDWGANDCVRDIVSEMPFNHFDDDADVPAVHYLNEGESFERDLKRGLQDQLFRVTKTPGYSEESLEDFFKRAGASEFAEWLTDLGDLHYAITECGRHINQFEFEWPEVIGAEADTPVKTLLAMIDQLVVQFRRVVDTPPRAKAWELVAEPVADRIK